MHIETRLHTSMVCRKSICSILVERGIRVTYIEAFKNFVNPQKITMWVAVPRLERRMRLC